MNVSGLGRFCRLPPGHVLLFLSLPLLLLLGTAIGADFTGATGWAEAGGFAAGTSVAGSRASLTGLFLRQLFALSLREPVLVYRLADEHAILPPELGLLHVGDPSPGLFLVNFSGVPSTLPAHPE